MIKYQFINMKTSGTTKLGRSSIVTLLPGGGGGVRASVCACVYDHLCFCLSTNARVKAS